MLSSEDLRLIEAQANVLEDDEGYVSMSSKQSH
jgi:hypothetical protein